MPEDYSIYRKAFRQAIISDHIDIINVLIKHIVKDINKQYSYKSTDKYAKTTFLIEAVCKNSIDIVEILLNNGADTNIQDDVGKTALFYAIEQNNGEITHLLLEKGAEVYKKDAQGESVLSYATKYYNKKNNNLDIIKLLLDKSNLNRGYEEVLIEAIKTHKKEIVKILLDKGANVNITDELGKTPLIYAIKKNNEKIIEILLDKGANINVTDKWGKTPLIYAIEENNERIVGILLDKGANVDTLESPLFYAVKKENDKFVGMLLEKGARNNLSSVLIYAQKENKKKIIELYINANDIIDILRYNHKPSDNVINFAIENLTKEEQIEVKKFLEQIKINNDLYMAIQEQNKDEIEKLITQGADVNYIKDSDSILAYALSQFHNDNDDVIKDIIRILLDNGAKYDFSIDEYWKSAPEDIYKLLKEKFNRNPRIGPSREKWIRGALINPNEGNVEQIGGYGNPNFPVMGWGNKSYDKNPDDED